MLKSAFVKRIDDYGRVVLKVDELIEHIFNGEDINGCYVFNTSEYEKYLKTCDMFDEQPVKLKRFKDLKSKYTKKSYLRECSEEWLIPEEYMQIDLIDYFLDKCKTKEEKERVILELNEFVQLGNIKIINVLIYLVDVMRKNNIVWGVGRGSSVSSYLLYLVGLNKINPLEYDIDYKEFFK